MNTIDQLVARSKSGDESAENELFQYLLVRFKSIAKRRIGETDAEDLAHEACVTVLEKYKKESFSKGFEPWAYGVLRMKIGNHIQGPLRKRHQESELDERQPGKKSAMELDPLLKQDLLRCMKKITAHNKKYAGVLGLTYQGYKTEEICRKLSIKANNMYVMLNRGRKMLKSCLASGRV